MKGKLFGFAGFEPLPTRWGRGPHMLMLDESQAGGAAAAGAAGKSQEGGAGTVTDPAAAKKDDVQQEKAFTQADVDRIINERLAREKAAREKDAAKAKETAEAEALKKNQEWQALAEKNAAKLAELEPLSEQVTRYKGALEKYLANEKKDLPKHVLVLLEKLDPVEQIEYIATNRAELGKGAAGTDGIPASPNPKQRTLSDEDQEKARRGQGQIYQNF